MRILQISDFHLRGDGRLSFRVVDTPKCLETAARHLLNLVQKPDMMVIHHRPVDKEIDLLTAHGLEGVADLRGLLRIVMMRGKMNQFSSSSTAVSSQWSFFGHFEQSLQIFCGNSSFSTVLNPRR